MLNNSVHYSESECESPNTSLHSCRVREKVKKCRRSLYLTDLERKPLSQQLKIIAASGTRFYFFIFISFPETDITWGYCLSKEAKNSS
jgi:hypothetical protein